MADANPKSTVSTHHRVLAWLAESSADSARDLEGKESDMRQLHPYGGIDNHQRFYPLRAYGARSEVGFAYSFASSIAETRSAFFLTYQHCAMYCLALGRAQLNITTPIVLWKDLAKGKKR